MKGGGLGEGENKRGSYIVHIIFCMARGMDPLCMSTFSGGFSFVQGLGAGGRDGSC